ncbi:MAG: hypothetical protein UY06_C0032G0005 [Candidatus Amesbacteria bacterium GW2011_GWA2_47_70]|nr:MAG: hypothetical protein UY06_C0032G0005 [Candidatus Amesbacteria bacterium GW2011_GWA2_47_70]
MVSPVPPSQYSRLLPFFPDIPENVHIRYFLTKERCEVYLVGDISNPHAAIIRPKFEILMSLQNWSSILIDNNISNQLASPLKLQDINFIKEIYLILDKPISTQDVNNARLLTAGDLRLLKDGPKQFYEAGLRDSREILSHGIAAMNLQAKNLIPVWSTDKNNLASLKVAQKIGFTQISIKTYICTQNDKLLQGIHEP